MKLIAGLGNPGKKFEKNRHNLGFMVIDKFVEYEGLRFRKSVDLMSLVVKTQKYVVCKPTTFMNDSGEALVAVRDYYKVKNGNVLVIHDDLDLELGKIRLAFGGSSAGHKGVDSAIKRLGEPDFARLRVGIGRPKNEKQEPADFVLENFSTQELGQLGQLLDKSVEAIHSFLADGIEATMNRFN